VGIDAVIHLDINAAVDSIVNVAVNPTNNLAVGPAVDVGLGVGLDVIGRVVVSIDKSRYGRGRYREYDRTET
jgi:hypothetical protein